MLDYALIKLPPSHRAAAAALLARATLLPSRASLNHDSDGSDDDDGGTGGDDGNSSSSTTVWPPLAQRVTGYTAAALEPCARRMRSLQAGAERNKTKIHAIWDRYMRREYMKVAVVCCLTDAELRIS